MENNRRYAGLWPRFLALCIDVAVFCALFFPVTRLIKGVWIMSASDHRWTSGLLITDPLCMAFLGIMAVYFVLLEGLAGATLGKRVLGLQVLGLDGGRPGLGASAIRNILRFIDGLPALNILGVALILRSPEHARYGDQIARTRVVHTRPVAWRSRRASLD
jgi:uncharacterized RDD family membrane protein YckC